MNNILYLEKRGCDFFKKDNLISNVGNYRICTTGENIHSNNGRTYFLEFTLWRNRGHYRTTYLYNPKKELKNPVFVVDIPEALNVSTQYTDVKSGFEFADLELENNISKLRLTYTLENILKVVNLISVIQYDHIEFID